MNGFSKTLRIKRNPVTEIIHFADEQRQRVAELKNAMVVVDFEQDIARRQIEEDKSKLASLQP